MDLTAEEYDCLGAIADRGCLIALNEDPERFVARASPRVGTDHPGWGWSVVRTLFLSRYIKKTQDGEYVVTSDGKDAWIRHGVMVDHSTVRAARVMKVVEENPGKVVSLSEFRAAKVSNDGKE